LTQPDLITSGEVKIARRIAIADLEQREIGSVPELTITSLRKISGGNRR
jgi:hypothetical protein